jgi:hypothetical protein
MKSKYHIEITTSALSEHFSQNALQTIIRANILQDRLRYQLQHDYIHFDSNDFERGFRYIQEQQELTISSIDVSDFTTARKAFGHICHSWQDFYSHSNYVRLWVNRVGFIPPCEIPHDDKQIMDSPQLKSGINYGLPDFLALIPGLRNVITPLMPEDSHARMNLDSPKSGKLFDYAYFAALKRTDACFKELLIELNTKSVTEKKISDFRGKQYKK